MYYKLGQACVSNWGSFLLLQIRTNVVTNRGSFIITNQGKFCYKMGQLLQIRATVITKQGSYYKSGQNVLQIGAGIANQGNYYKLEHNKRIVYPHLTSSIQLEDFWQLSIPTCNTLTTHSGICTSVKPTIEFFQVHYQRLFLDQQKQSKDYKFS